MRISSTFSALWLASAPAVAEQGLAVRLRFGLRPGIGRRQSGLDPLRHELLGLLDEGGHHLVLGHHADDLPLDEQVSPPPPGGDADIGLARLARAVHHAPHHRHLDRQLTRLERLLGGPGHADHVDLGPPARGAGDEVEALALAQPHGLEQLAPGARLFDGVGGERVADGVADPLGQERGDAGRPLDQPRRRRPGLGDPQV